MYRILFLHDKNLDVVVYITVSEACNMVHLRSTDTVTKF